MEPVQIGDDYRVERKLASGGFGTVYLATQLSLDRYVCVKRIHPHMMGHAEVDTVAMFLDEARLVAKLRHENVCRVMDCLRDAEGVPVIVMDYIEGCDVQTLLKRHGPLPWRSVAYILIEVLKALVEAHEPDPSTGRPALIHRDIKGGNVMLSNRGTVAVGDFGIARAVEDAGGLNYTNNYKGSLPYAAPEQLRPGTPFDRRVDLWQLGVMGWEMLSGSMKRPFEDESLGARGMMDRQMWVAQNILADRRRPTREAFAHLPPDAGPLLDVIDSLLKPAKDRIRNAYDAMERLVEAGYGLPTERREIIALVQEVRPQGPRTLPDRPGHGATAPDASSGAERAAATDPSPPPSHAGQIERTAPLPADTAPLPLDADLDSDSQLPVSSGDLLDGPAVLSPAPAAPSPRRKLLVLVAALSLLAAALLAFSVAFYFGPDGIAVWHSGENTVTTDTAKVVDIGRPSEPIPTEPPGAAPAGSTDAGVADADSGPPNDAGTNADSRPRHLPVLDAGTEEAPGSPCRLYVVVAPEGRILVDGASQGAAPRHVVVDPGEHIIVGVGAHGARAQRRVRCTDGERRRIAFDFL